jgi:hypothetical protein
MAHILDTRVLVGTPCLNDVANLVQGRFTKFEREVFSHGTKCIKLVLILDGDI